jgi:hypothetical protein
VRNLEGETLLNLLEMYEAALAELRTTDYQGVAGLIARLERRQAEVIAAIAAKNSETGASPRQAAPPAHRPGGISPAGSEGPHRPVSEQDGVSFREPGPAAPSP